MSKIAELSQQLSRDEYGIMRSPATPDLAYPLDGNEKCFGLEDNSYWFRHRNDCIVAVIRRFPPTGTILDVGGGNGFVARRLLDEGIDAALLEPGPTGAFNGKTRRKIPTVLCSTLDGAGFPPESLPSIGCFDVIEHIEDDQQFIKQVHEFLRPQGLFYGTAPAHAVLWSDADEEAKHFRRHSRKTINALLESRFETLYFTYFFGCLMVPIFCMRTIPSLFSLSKRQAVLSPETEHGCNGGRLVKPIEMILRRELRAITNGKARLWGASCLFAARKL